MNTLTMIGSSPWSDDEMREAIKGFVPIYGSRPIRDNHGGMISVHMFLAWFALRKLNPKVIIESGVFKGQGTWLLEQACPDAQLHCIDVDLDNIQYRSKKAIYYSRDFSTISWDHLPKSETVLFFDDHQNAFERVKQARRFGFSHVIFEDNYPPLQGDCYSLKKVFARSGFFLFTGMDAQYLKKNLEIYCELPPVFQVEKTRWNDLWDDQNYPTPTPLFKAVQDPGLQVFLDEAMWYTWMCYVKIKKDGTG